MQDLYEVKGKSHACSMTELECAVSAAEHRTPYLVGFLKERRKSCARLAALAIRPGAGRWWGWVGGLRRWWGGEPASAPPPPTDPGFAEAHRGVSGCRCAAPVEVGRRPTIGIRLIPSAAPILWRGAWAPPFQPAPPPTLSVGVRKIFVPGSAPPKGRRSRLWDQRAHYRVARPGVSCTAKLSSGLRPGTRLPPSC
jgi:hypothetical protein